MDGLQKLFRPKSIAVIGGGEWGRNIIRNSRAIRYAGDIWPVHPVREELEGEAAYRSIPDLPGVPDAAYLAVNRHLTIAAAAELSAMGAGGAVCLASGFREAQAEDADGADLQEQLLAAAGDMILVGPNCYGFVNYLDGAALWPDQHGGAHVDTGVAIISQSSNIAMNISMQRRGVPVAYLATAGNQAQIGLSRIGAAMLADPRVTALGLHIEGIDDLRAFEALALAAREQGTPVVALKAGKSEHAQLATVSHTASLAGSDAGSRALLARLGIAQVETIPVFLETLKLLHITGPLKSNRIASMSCSGGEASLIADAAVDLAVGLPPLTRTQHSELRAALGPMVALNNPLDYHTYIWRNAAALGDTFTAMMDPDLALGVIILDFPREDRCTVRDWYDVVTGALRARSERATPMAIVATIHENMPEHEALRLLAAGIAPMCGLDEALKAIEAAAWLGQGRAWPGPLLPPSAVKSRRSLSEAGAKAALSAHGIRAPRSAEAASPADASRAAGDIGFPVVLKGRGIAHKTEAGAVALNLMSADAVRAAAGAMPANGFLVEEMITGTVAELLVGVVLDPAHGYVLTLAAGGVLTELLEDRASLLIPASRQAVETALNGLRIARVLDGYRGAAAADRDAILDCVMAVQAFVAAWQGKLEEIEINPLLCGENRAVAADALIVTGERDDRHTDQDPARGRDPRSYARPARGQCD